MSSAASNKPARRSRVLWCCALASALGHGIVLATWQDHGGNGQASAPAGIIARMLPSDTGQAVTAAAALHRAQPATASTVPPAQAQAPVSAPAPAVESDAVTVLLAQEPSDANHPSAGMPTSPAEDPAAGQGDVEGDDLYLARSDLDQAPAAQSMIELPYPEAAPLGRYRAVLTLFIDASGQVQRVRSEGARLPPSLDDAARQAFLAAHFEPGLKDGQPVRSRIRVEVEYIAERLPPRQSAAAESADKPELR